MTALPLPELPLSLRIVRKMPVGWDIALRVMARGNPALRAFPVRLNGVARPIVGDLGENMFAILFRFGHLPWQVGLDRFCRATIKPGATVFDIGANVGFTSAVFSQLVGPSGRVIAFEPAPGTFAMLTKALDGFGNVTPVNLGLSEQMGEIDFYVPKRHDMAGSKPRRGAAHISVKTCTLDDAVAKHGEPAFVKIDVEGFEPAVLAGGRRTLAEIRPVIAFEALTAAERDRSVAVIRDLSGDRYAFHRIARDGRLVGLAERGTPDHVALPRS